MKHATLRFALVPLALGLTACTTATPVEDPPLPPAPEEIANRAIARRSLVATRPIAVGESFSLDNLTAKRPADGLSPMAIWPLLGRPSPRAYAEDEAVEG